MTYENWDTLLIGAPASHWGAFTRIVRSSSYDDCRLYNRHLEYQISGHVDNAQQEVVPSIRRELLFFNSRGSCVAVMCSVTAAIVKAESHAALRTDQEILLALLHHGELGVVHTWRD